MPLLEIHRIDTISREVMALASYNCHPLSKLQNPFSQQGAACCESLFITLLGVVPLILEQCRGQSNPRRAVMYQIAVRYAGHRHGSGSGLMRALTAILEGVITRSQYLTYQSKVFNKAFSCETTHSRKCRCPTLPRILT